MKGLISLLFCVAVLVPVARAEAPPVRVLASFSILADMVGAVGGNRVQVSSLVGAGQDAHAFAPRASDIRALKAAQVVVHNGLGFEPWMARMLRAARFEGQVVVATDGITPRVAENDHAGHANHHGHEGMVDPHAWLDPRNAHHYVHNIAAGLSAADPAGKTYYAARAADYRKQVDALHAELQGRLARLPVARRTIVTPHDSFGYFGNAYGLRFIAPAGLSNEVAPSAAAVAKLISQLRTLKVEVVYLENFADNRLIDRIRKEAGARSGGLLYSDALSQAGTASTYLGLMRHNVETLLDDGG